jgi:hypothetical protein
MARALALVAVTVAVLAPSAALAQTPAPTVPRQGLLEYPEGCPVGALPDVVFVGTLQASDFRTARLRVDQVRAGDMSQFAVGELVDVRYGVDTKYLEQGEQYLIGARYDSTAGLLSSKVQPAPQQFGGDEIIGATESDRQCPAPADAVMTLHTNGTAVQSGLLTPLVDDRRGLLRALLLPAILVIGGLLAIVAFRWLLTGFGRSVNRVNSAQAQAAREKDAARRAAARQQAPSQPEPSRR